MGSKRAQPSPAQGQGAPAGPADTGKGAAGGLLSFSGNGPGKRSGNSGSASGSQEEHRDEVRSFGVVRSLAWAAMTLTVVLSVIVSIYLGNMAGKALLSKSQSFALLLADNLNNQIYRRFTLPTVSIFGRVDLNNPEQYRALDGVIQSIILGLNVDDVRIFSHNRAIRYSTNSEERNETDLATPSVERAFTEDGPIFDTLDDIPYWQAFFRLSLEPETFRLRTTYPLRIENRVSSSTAEGPFMGVLEFTQDITKDIKSSIQFQQLVLGVTLLSSGMLMVLLMLLVRRAELALAVRVAEAQRLQRELHQHEKLAGMGRVVASIAHEIRNPLGIISSSAELLLRRAGDESPGTARVLEAIYDEAKRLSRTVSDFLDYARPRQPKQEPVEIGKVIDQALTFLGPDMAEREIGVVRAGVLDRPLYVPGDRDLLYRAFYNIMGNAIQAMGAAGTLTITLGGSAEPEPSVSLVFHDSGCGFPEDNMAQLLDPFFTTKDDGTGLGLPIVNSIITSHNGTLTLGNAQDGGAEVRVTLPTLPPGSLPGLAAC